MLIILIYNGRLLFSHTCNKQTMKRRFRCLLSYRMRSHASVNKKNTTGNRITNFFLFHFTGLTCSPF